jgi:hypothetical protein
MQNSELAALKSTVQLLMNRAALVDTLDLQVQALVVKAGRAEAMEVELQDIKRQLAALGAGSSTTGAAASDA